MTNNQAKEINKTAVLELLSKAGQLLKDGQFIEALGCYDRVVQLEKENHEAFFGLYMSWWNWRRIYKSWDLEIERYFDNSIRYAPLEKQKEYNKIWNENSAIFSKEGNSDEQK